MTYIERIVDVQTGETTEREYTTAEIAQVEKRILKSQGEVAALTQAEADKAAAQAKLAALGLTTDDLKALGL
jgi:small-conductance mechanosensitive channel